MADSETFGGGCPRHGKPAIAKARVSALPNASRAVPSAVLIEAVPDLVGLTDIADAVGMSRQNVRNLVLAKLKGILPKQPLRSLIAERDPGPAHSKSLGSKSIDAPEQQVGAHAPTLCGRDDSDQCDDRSLIERKVSSEYHACQLT
ncbi:hypothetical protein FHX60_000078 [Cupriavidus alkaliphilus]|nr:hypothetical protein [Cupriavidus alkaliphilus]MBB2915709.1 hypothetical protein [Cupriavidus alkaliphilus]